MKRIATALTASALALGAQAAEPIGSLSKVEGIVSIGGQGFAANAKAGAKLFDGSTITVTTRGKATVTLNDGCVVPLRGGQFLTIDGKLTCSQLYAGVTQLAAPYQVVQAGGTVAGGGAAGAGAGAGLLVGAVVVGTGALLLNANDPLPVSGQ